MRGEWRGYDYQVHLHRDSMTFGRGSEGEGARERLTRLTNNGESKTCIGDIIASGSNGIWKDLVRFEYRCVYLNLCLIRIIFFVVNK
jgi:hypothetical protein